MISLKEAENRWGYILAVLFGIVFLIGGYYLGILSLMGLGVLAIVLTIMTYMYLNQKGEIS